MVDLEAQGEADQMLMCAILVAKNIETASVAGRDRAIVIAIETAGAAVLAHVHAIASAPVDLQGRDREIVNALGVILVHAQGTGPIVTASGVTEAIAKKAMNGVRLGLRMNPRMAMANTTDALLTITDSMLKSRLSKTRITSLLVPAMADLGISRCSF